MRSLTGKNVLKFSQICPALVWNDSKINGLKPLLEKSEGGFLSLVMLRIDG